MSHSEDVSPAVDSVVAAPPLLSTGVDSVTTLQPFFRPRTVAVVGASRRPGGLGYRLLQALLQGDFQVTIYPVNPHAKALCGLLAYPSVRAIPDQVDLAVIATPREAVLGVVDDCAAAGVPALLVITAGFAEVGGP